jgi:hypothetical protein
MFRASLGVGLKLVIMAKAWIMLRQAIINIEVMEFSFQSLGNVTLFDYLTLKPG